MNPPASADLARASSAPRRRALSLRSQLIWGLLPIVLLPLLLVSAMGYRLTQHRSEGRLQRQLANQALLTSEGTQAVLDDLRSVPRLIARHPLVVSEALAGSATAERGGLAQLPVEVLEDRFRDRKLLRQPFRLNAHLQIMTGTAEVSKILITEKHGLTVAYSDRAVDFVQRDEQWWQRGRQDGSWISPPDFDAVARVYTVDFVQAIYNPRTQGFLGVVRATLPARKFDRLAQSVQRTGISGSQRVQLVDSLSLKVIDTFSPPGIQGELTLIGSEPLEQVIAALAKFPRPAQAGAAYASQLTETLRALPGIQQVNVLPAENGTALISFVQSQRQYKLATIPATDWLAIASMGQGEMLAVGRGTLGLFVVVTLMLGGVTTVLLVLVANKLSTPLNKLSLAAEKVAGGYPLAIPDMAIPDMTSPDLAAFNLAASDLTTPTYYANETLETRRLAGAFKQWVSVTQRLLNRQALDAKRAQAWTTLTGTDVNDLPSFKAMLDSALPNVRTLLGADRVLFAQALPDKTYAVEALTLGPDVPLQEWQPQWLLPQVTRVEEIPHTVVINQLEQSLLSADAY
ncbi:MAG: PDC sensor domain-containing protein, partial [Cyanobacteria bacterium P01_A01_bin.105]